jgi:hypothetical protein
MRFTFILPLLLSLFFFSCKESKNVKTYQKEKNDDSNNFNFSGHFYSGELIELRINDSVVLYEQVVADTSKILNKYFLVDYTSPFKALLKTSYKGRIYLDTVLRVSNPKEGENYKITVTHPHPYDWKKYFKDGVPFKKWGYLPIDSSIRFIHLTTF